MKRCILERNPERIRLLNRTESGYYITSCDIQASNDDFQTFVTLSQLSGLTVAESKVIEFEPTEAYTGYRVYIYTSSGPIGVGIRAFDIYGYILEQ